MYFSGGPKMNDKHIVSIALNPADADKLSQLQSITLQNPKDTFMLAVELALCYFYTIKNARLKNK